MFKPRQVASLLMILSLALAVTGCGGTSGSDAPQTEPADQDVAVEQTETDAPSDEGDAAPAADPQEGGLRLASVKGSCDEDVALLAGEWNCKAFDSVDSLAKAFIAGDVNIAVVAPDAAAALYNATGGSAMALDAVTDDASVPRSVSVVRMPAFTSNPDQVVAYVTRHQELVGASLGEDRFLRGSAMQRELTEAIEDAYVADSSRIGGELPPDNFFFLG